MSPIGSIGSAGAAVTFETSVRPECSKTSNGDSIRDAARPFHQDEDNIGTAQVTVWWDIDNEREKLTFLFGLPGSQNP